MSPTSASEQKTADSSEAQRRAFALRERVQQTFNETEVNQRCEKVRLEQRQNGERTASKQSNTNLMSLLALMRNSISQSLLGERAKADEQTDSGSGSAVHISGLPVVSESFVSDIAMESATMRPLSSATGPANNQPSRLSVSSNASNVSENMRNVVREIETICTQYENNMETSDDADDEPRESQLDARQMLNITVSTILMLANGSTAIPPEYFQWTDRFLNSVKNENTNPVSVQNLIDYLKTNRAKHLISWEEPSDVRIHAKPTAKKSRIPVAINSVSSRLSALKIHGKSISQSASFPSSTHSIASAMSIRSNNPIQRLAHQPGFNKIFSRLLFPDMIDDGMMMNPDQRCVINFNDQLD